MRMTMDIDHKPEATMSDHARYSIIGESEVLIIGRLGVRVSLCSLALRAVRVELKSATGAV